MFRVSDCHVTGCNEIALNIQLFAQIVNGFLRQYIPFRSMRVSRASVLLVRSKQLGQIEWQSPVN